MYVGTALWDQGKKYPDIAKSLDNFGAWNKPSKKALWVLFDDCWAPPACECDSGAAGMAFMGVLCSGDGGAGIVSKSSNTWQTFAHEVGHILNAAHSWEDGQGTRPAPLRLFVLALHIPQHSACMHVCVRWRHHACFCVCVRACLPKRSSLFIIDVTSMVLRDHPKKSLSCACQIPLISFPFLSVLFVSFLYILVLLILI